MGVAAGPRLCVEVPGCHEDRSLGDRVYHRFQILVERFMDIWLFLAHSDHRAYTMIAYMLLLLSSSMILHMQSQSFMCVKAAFRFLLTMIPTPTLL